MKDSRKYYAMLLCAVIVQCMLLTACGSSKTDSIKVGIAWSADTNSEFYTNICAAVTEAGGEPILLKQAIDYDLVYEDNMIAEEGTDKNDYLTAQYAESVKKNTYHNSNISDILSDVDAVIFTGGEDISPTLLKNSCDWSGIEAEKDFNAARDVSDYLLMAYCIDNDIPTMGFCRGMQMLAVVSGADIIQDIPTFFQGNNMTYQYEHRNEKKTPESYRDYAPHDISILTHDSIIYDIYKTDTVKNVPSWHHQAVKSADGTKLRVTASTKTDGYDIIECIERTDKSFIVGFQFHPEAAVVKHLNAAENADRFMDADSAQRCFQYFVHYIQENYHEKAA